MKIKIKFKSIKHYDIKITFHKKHKFLQNTNIFLYKKQLFVKLNKNFEESIKSLIDFIESLKENKFYIETKFLDNKQIYKLLEFLVLYSYNFSYKKKNYKVKVFYLKVKNKELLKKHLKVLKNINLVRDIINSVANKATPKKLVQWIIKELKSTDIKYYIKSKKYIKKNLPAFYDVSKGSINKPYLLHLKLNENKGYKKVILIGKGITFDTGGISLKPSNYMSDMRLDKTGAIIAFGIIKTISELNLPYEVHVIIGFAENMISNKAYKPGDVLETRRGKTIEILNTDAEGRILLADLLEYSQDNIKDIDYIFDFATLTGSVISAIGQYSCAVIGHNTLLKEKIIKAGKKVNELYVDLPFNKYFFEGCYDSNIADLTNIPTSDIGGGTILGGVFLDNFLDKKYKKNWLHFDMTGVSFIKHNWEYNRFGATGFGIKSFVQFIKML